MKTHYYRLEGESLQALNKLIEYDRLLTDFRMTDVRKKLAEIMGKEGPEEDPEVLQMTLSTHFTSAQVRGYKEKLGFNDPCVQVRNCGDDLLYRAYHVYPKIAMNPGTSKANFGIGDLFKDDTIPAAERVAIYNAYEDYKGQHFVPQGAIPMTDEEFEAYQPQSDSFEFYRTHDEGIATPADFDPAKHQTVPSMNSHELLKASHLFLVTGEAQEAMVAYDKNDNDWIIKGYQPFRSWMEKDLIPALGISNARVSVWVDDVIYAGKERVLDLGMSKKVWELHKDYLQTVFTLKDLQIRNLGDHHALLVPREDNPFGQEVIAELAKVVTRPVRPNFFGFDTNPAERAVEYKPGITGFPYMKVESYDEGYTQLLVFRMPSHVKTIAPPPDCQAVSLDDYAAIAGSETSDVKPASHVFMLTGESLAMAQKYTADMNDYVNKNAALKEKVRAYLKPLHPDMLLDKVALRYYKRSSPRDLELAMASELYVVAKDAIAQAFTVQYANDGCGHHCGLNMSSLLPNPETAIGREFAEMIEQTPFMPDFPNELYKGLGFNMNKSYHLMRIESLDGLDQKILVHHFPAYITGVEAPKNTVALTREEFMQILCDSWDIRGGSPPPPRPEHMKHLPMSEGHARYENAIGMKKQKDGEGLPLHPRSDISWFKVRGL